MARLEINGKWFKSTIVCINTMSNSKDMFSENIDTRLNKNTISNGRCVGALRKLSIILTYNTATTQMSSQQVVKWFQKGSYRHVPRG